MELKPVQTVESVDEYFQCSCSTDEHTLRMSYHPWDEDKDLYTSMFMCQYHGVFKRMWIAFKYILGYKSKYGHWDCWILKKEDAFRLRNLVDKYISECGLVIENGVVKEPKDDKTRT